MRELKGLATGIGSLPHKDAKSALDLIFQYLPDIPFWPQLPKRDVREGMISQYSEGLPCIEVNQAGIFFNPQDKEKKLEKFYEKIINHDLEYFRISEAFSQGLHAFYQRLGKINLAAVKFIKCQISGPFTFSASLKDEKGVVLLHDPVFMQAVTAGLAMKALWQLSFFKEFAKKIIMFIDEPYLGCFGSAYTPINRQDVVKVLADLAKELKRQDILLGVHCCGNTDWSIFTEIKDIDIISFDAFSFLDKIVLYADCLKEFLQQARALCWGIVPTQDFSGQEKAGDLVNRIKQGVSTLINKGLDKNSLWENLLISPACGLGTLEPAQAEQIFRLLSEVSRHLK